MNNGDHLPDRWQRIIQRVATGEDFRPAARAEGCSASYAAVLRTRMMKNPKVVKAIESIRAEGRTMAVYDLATAMAEAEAVCAFAKLHKNAMAYCKGTELRAKLSGLLIDRVELVEVDLRGSLARAEARVINAIAVPGPSCDARLPAPLPNGATRWKPRIAGDLEDPEAGPAESK